MTDFRLVDGRKYIDAGSSGEWGWHATELALRCLQLYAWKYRSGGCLDGASSDRPALIKGSLAHAGLAHYYRRKQAVQEGEDVDEWLTPDAAIEVCAADMGSAAMSYVDLIKRAVAAYIAYYLHERLEVLFVEEVFGLEIEGRRYTQRIDLGVREPDGKVVFIDHKSTGFFTKAAVQRFTLSGQFLGMQTIGTAVYGKDFGGVRANMCEVNESKQTFKFSRELVDMAPHALTRFPLTVVEARERVERMDAKGVACNEWPKTLSEQVCVGPYGRCEAFDLCRWGR